MRSLANSVREFLRKCLLRILIFTEKRAEQAPLIPRSSRSLFRDIHIPSWVTLAFTGASLYAVLILSAGITPEGLFSLALLVILILTLFVFYLRMDFPVLIQDDEAMMLLGTLTVFFVMMIGLLKNFSFSVVLTPIPAASILACLLLHPRLSVILTVSLSVIFAVLHNFSFECFALAFFGGVAGTASAVYIRTHKHFMRAGAGVAAAQFLTLLALMSFLGGDRRYFAGQSLLTLGNGFLSAVLALGLLPYLESFFSRVTPLRLLDLADFNQPLLKRLMVEAPGTYHHSLMMAAIAEAAARAIGANALLCRVGAYYHDIGKLVKPEYFIENQGGLGNPHGNLAPALSSLVVVSHVKEGMALARAAKVPEEIVNFIPMHHGTSRVEYFYSQAREDAEEEFLKNLEGGDSGHTEVGEQNFRYPGPRPKSKETAILMLADSIEAASRTIEEPSHSRYKDIVDSLVQKKLDDGQLADSPLTLSDLNKIKEQFVNTLTTVHHARIEYPKEEGNV